MPVDATAFARAPRWTRAPAAGPCWTAAGLIWSSTLARPIQAVW